MENLHVWTGSGTRALKALFVLSNQTSSFQVHSPEPRGCTESCTSVHHLLRIFLQLKSSVVGFREVAGRLISLLVPPAPSITKNYVASFHPSFAVVLIKPKL